MKKATKVKWEQWEKANKRTDVLRERSDIAVGMMHVCMRGAARGQSGSAKRAALAKRNLLDIELQYARMRQREAVLWSAYLIASELENVAPHSKG